jgi:glutamyl-tRNA reductase
MCHLAEDKEAGSLENKVLFGHYGGAVHEELLLESQLAVIGVNHKSSSLAVRERFWFSESRLYAALQHLAKAEGIEEVVLLVTCNRTEFILWACNLGRATESLRGFLADEFGLQDSEWKCFYRLSGDEALTHVFRVAASLDSLIVGEPHIVGQVKSAWGKAQQAGATGRHLDAVFRKALTVSKRVRNSTAIGDAAVSVPYAAVELARQIYGELRGRKVLILGAGKMGELSARYLAANGASSVLVTNRTYEHAKDLAGKLQGVAVPYEERWRHLADADIVISSTGCPHVIIAREDAERISRERAGRQLLMIDIAVPRDIDPAVREVPGILLYNIDNLEQAVAHNLDERRAAAAQAEAIVVREALAFRQRLAAQRVVPTLVALKSRLEEIRHQELENYQSELGPLSQAQAQALEELSSRTVERIAEMLGRELRETREIPEQDRLTAAVRRLFHLPQPPAALEA